MDEMQRHSSKLPECLLTTSERNYSSDGISQSVSAVGAFKHAPTECKSSDIIGRGGKKQLGLYNSNINNILLSDKSNGDPRV